MTSPLVNVDTKKHTHTTVRFIEILLDESTAMLTRHGKTLPDARKISCEFVEAVCGRLHGSLMYFGKNNALEAQARHSVIKNDHSNGATIKQLTTKYGVSERQIYNIVHYKKDAAPAKAATRGAPVLAILAARMMMQIGLNKDDAKSAARGLLAVIAVKMGGSTSYIANPRFVKGIIKQIEIVRYYHAGKTPEDLAARFNLSVEDIRTIINNHPKAITPDASELPKIKTRLFSMAASFSGYAEINTLLGEATERISRAEQIIASLGGEKCQEHKRQ